MTKLLTILSLMALMAGFTSCNNTTPLPRAYFHIDLEQKAYHPSKDNRPYQFDYPKKTLLIYRKKNKDWFDLIYPNHHARIHCSYKAINKDFYEVSEDARKFVYKHTVMATAITQQPFEDPEKKMYGTLYELTGNVASPIQFVLTDSTNHFLRGALYFNNKPNQDSLAPVIGYIKEDIIRLMESNQWED